MKRKILLIDDDRILRENIAEILQFAGYNITTASNGKNGVEKIFTDDPDLIICDIMMPKLDGIGVYKIMINN